MSSEFSSGSECTFDRNREGIKRVESVYFLQCSKQTLSLLEDKPCQLLYYSTQTGHMVKISVHTKSHISL